MIGVDALYHGTKAGGVASRVVASSIATAGAVARSSGADIASHRSFLPIFVRLVTLAVKVVLATVTLMIPAARTPVPHEPSRTSATEGEKFRSPVVAFTSTLYPSGVAM